MSQAGLFKPVLSTILRESQIEFDHLRRGTLAVAADFDRSPRLDLSGLSHFRNTLSRLWHDSSNCVSVSRQLERGDHHARVRAALSGCADGYRIRNCWSAARDSIA
jgi:hypothetical protein